MQWMVPTWFVYHPLCGLGDSLPRWAWLSPWPASWETLTPIHAEHAVVWQPCAPAFTFSSHEILRCPRSWPNVVALASHLPSPKNQE